MASSDNAIQVKQKLLTLQTEYEELFPQKAENSVIRLKLNSERAINAIQKYNGEITTDPLEINHTFVTFCKALYQSDYLINSATQDNYLDRLNLPSISEDVRLELDKKRGDLEHVPNAILNMKGGKAARQNSPNRHL